MTDRLDSLERRLEAVIAEVDRLRAEQASARATDSESSTSGTSPLWALEQLRARIDGTHGGAMFVGIWEPESDKAEHPRIEWQFGRTADDLVELDWADSAGPLAALGHPVRLELLKRVLTGTTSTRELAETDGLGTSGQLHHHLRTLVAAGWLRQRHRGDYEVPGARVIPLLTIITATSDS